MKSDPSGFTLIELTIVIAIIAILAAIAIPNLRESRRNGNEASAIASMRQYLNAQVTYVRNDYDSDGQKEFASLISQLYDHDGAAGAIDPIKLVDLATARAEYSAGYDITAPRSGYYFADHTGDEEGDFESDTGGNGYINGFGLTAFASSYKVTGLTTFIINSEGTVYRKNIVDLDFDNQGDLPSEWPDVEADGWIAEQN